MTSEQIPALRALLDAASGSPLQVVVEPNTDDPFALMAHNGAVYVATVHDRGRSHADQPAAWARLIAAAINNLPELLDAAEERNRLLAALDGQETEFIARSLHPDGLDEGFRQGMGRVVTAIRNAADGTGENDDAR